LFFLIVTVLFDLVSGTLEYAFQAFIDYFNFPRPIKLFSCFGVSVFMGTFMSSSFF
jgi:hypothetical protein